MLEKEVKHLFFLGVGTKPRSREVPIFSNTIFEIKLHPTDLHYTFERK